MHRLKELRKSKNLTQKEIAKLLNMSQTGYSQYELEINDVSTDILIKLAEIYNTSIDYIINLTNIKDPYKKTNIIKSNDIHNRLQEIRKDRDLRQEEVAKILNMQRSGYCKYEIANNDISSQNLKKLAIYFNVSADYILYLTDERVPHSRIGS